MFILFSSYVCLVGPAVYGVCLTFNNQQFHALLLVILIEFYHFFVPFIVFMFWQLCFNSNTNPLVCVGKKPLCLVGQDPHVSQVAEVFYSNLWVKTNMIAKCNLCQFNHSHALLMCSWKSLSSCFSSFEYRVRVCLSCPCLLALTATPCQ